MKEIKTDLFIYGANAAGIVAAVRGAREGLKVVLAFPTAHIGGSLPSLGALETHYRGVRAPLLKEFEERIVRYYLQAFGEYSEAYKICSGGNMVTFEPHVAQAILKTMLQEECGIQQLSGYFIGEIHHEGRKLQTVRLDHGDGESVTIHAATFFDATYEGDLMSRCNVAFRLGRESRGEYLEPHAGKIFSFWLNGLFPVEAHRGRLHLTVSKATTLGHMAGSTGEGDSNIQSYSIRLCLSNDPDNRLLLSKPPEGYDRETYAPILLPAGEKEDLRLPFHHRFLIQSLREMIENDHVFHGHALPNGKRSWNATNLTGGGKDYPNADPATRREIYWRHVKHALGLMWFLQNDEEVPGDLKKKAQEWGLALDEFADTGNIPEQLYIREARRLRGRSVFTENDALIAPGLDRAPIHPQSIAITEFSLDSLACTCERRPGTLCDGQFFQMEASRPGQIPLGVLLPLEFDNLLVITCVSATHVGWGTVRQTPTLMHLAESAAQAAVLASKQKIQVAELPIDLLQRHLVERGILLSFFNDVDMSENTPTVTAIQYLGTKGFFSSYDAFPEDDLTKSLANVWVAAAESLLEETNDPNKTALAVQAAQDQTLISYAELVSMLGQKFSQSKSVSNDRGKISRGEACRLIYQFLRDHDSRRGKYNGLLK